MRLILLSVLLGGSIAAWGDDRERLDEALKASEPVKLWTFDSHKNGVLQSGGGKYPTLSDPGSDSIYDFRNGDEITIEALIDPDQLRENGVILSKGRTHNEGFSRNNQNWALRLRKSGGEAALNFLFHSASDGKNQGAWHRWTSRETFPVGSGWHHVAISYRFGQPESLRGYIDGKPVKGTWDMGGATIAEPVVDDDEVWIGAAMGGAASNRFYGGIDSVALHRRIVPSEVLEKRWTWKAPPLHLPDPVPGVVQFHMHGPFEGNSTLPAGDGEPLISWQQPSMGFVGIPRKYDDWGVREDWGTAVLVKAVTEIELEPGNYEFLARTRSRSRLYVDGKVLLDFPKQKRGGGAHNKVKPVAEVPRQGMRPPAMDDVEKTATFSTPGGRHTVAFLVMAGGPKLRLEFGETCVALSRGDEMFRLIGPGNGPELTDAGWEGFREETEQYLESLDRDNRRSADQQEANWRERHRLAIEHFTDEKTREQTIDSLIGARLQNVTHRADSFYHSEVKPLLSEHCHRCHGEKEKGGLNLDDRENIITGGDSGIPTAIPGEPGESYLLEVVGPDAGDERMPPKGDLLSEEQVAVLEKWIADGVEIYEADTRSIEPTPVVDDLTFLRRVWIDTVGVAPPLEEVRRFLDDENGDRRDRVISRLVKDDRFAGNWMGYWQDVLAENPNLLKPMLNNTGPFRHWIYESLEDNKPLDRFATELISMRGSTWGGGAGGFSVASQNDVPMAAKAHIIGTAFLGVDMKCARCHDAPYHETTQQDLFELAAMLKREAIEVPATSSVPAAFFEHVEKGGRKSLIEVTLDIGSKVEPVLPFPELQGVLPDGVVGESEDSRTRLAAAVTFSRRFAEVMANRIWQRYMGAGLVEKVDDWEGQKPSDPALLAYLTDSLIRTGYDLREFSALILKSDAYQREAIDRPANLAAADRYFEGPYRRRMSAEQVVDNAYSVSGREMKVGDLTMDIEGRLAPDWFMNFGRPQRAWEFTTLANERDRPSLAMPRIQAVVDVLLSFGWRNSRQEPTSYRIEEPNALQPGVLGNGVMGGWLTRLTDESEVTRLCLEASSPEQLVEDLFLRYLTRFPTDTERDQYVALLSDGFDYRIIPADKVMPPPSPKRYPHVSWSNHLDSEANSIKQMQEEDARAGDLPTRFLRDTWREQAEDAIWALFNSPEMILIP